MPSPKKPKGQWGGRRAGAGRKKGSTYSERQELAGILLGLDNYEHRLKIRKMFLETPGLVQSPAFRHLSQYYFGKLPDAEQQRDPGKGMVVAFLRATATVKGGWPTYDPLADRMPKALAAGQKPTIIDQPPPEPPPDPDHPTVVDIPEQA